MMSQKIVFYDENNHKIVCDEDSYSECIVRLERFNTDESRLVLTLEFEDVDEASMYLAKSSFGLISRNIEFDYYPGIDHIKYLCTGYFAKAQKIYMYGQTMYNYEIISCDYIHTNSHTSDEEE